MFKEIDCTQLESLISTDKKLFLLDIRSDAEVMGGMLPNSRHLPMHLIPVKLDEFPEDRNVVLYCRTGARSYHACSYLIQQGFDNVINLKGGIVDWARCGFDIEAYA